MSAQSKNGGGFALFGLLVGLAAGLAVYGIAEHWAEGADQRPAQSAALAVAAFAAALLLLAEKGAILRAVLPAAAIAAVLSAPNWFMLATLAPDARLDPFPVYFWFFVGAPLGAYLMTTLAKAALLERFPPPYTGVFFHGLTLPLIAAGAHFFAALATVLLFAWAMLLKSMEIEFFIDLFGKPWFILPFFGAIGGLSVAMMRGLESVLGALRYILLLFCRIAMPITAAFSLTFIVALAVKGPEAIFIGPTPSGIMLALAFAGMLIFNGVYQNGEGGPPPVWLRLSTIAALIAFPVYSGLAAYALWLRVEDYGLTPPRVFGLAMNGLAALYSVVCLAGLVTEANWRAKRWMPFVAPLNTAMAAIWVAVLVLLATPVADPWRMSAADQERRLLDRQVAADAFDYSYLRFGLGAHGAAALERLSAVENHPEGATIRARAAAALAETGRWGPNRRAEEPAPVEERDVPANPDGPMSLPLNPGPEAGEDDYEEAPEDSR